MSQIIRIGEPKDIAILAENNIAMAMETENKILNKDTITQGVSSIINDRVKGIYWVMEIDDNLVGQLMITYEWSDWRNGTMWWIQSVFVPEGYRRQGVYSSLYENLVNLADSDHDCCGIRLYVEKNNTRAAETYSKLGMVNAGYEIMEYSKN
ncbi:MAG: GNAT superfamily N-acetyltransferase [Woeseiaceae bacterium]|jgi:GNAT superfamily N-acetyltransferase|tara:strand:- start:53317 stop:53772 length:456 start_codon:yes stop_codon:yes gene_type:complete